MTDHGILFSGEMVRALLARRKRVTRRMSKRWLRVKAGDTLWVRETWAPFEYCYYDFKPSEIPQYAQIVYLADQKVKSSDDKYRPSIHMPRWASRISLVATEDAREGKLWDITPSEIEAEGINEQALQEMLLPSLNRRPSVPMHWIGGYDEGFSWCRQCAEKHIRKLRKQNPGKEYYLDGGWATEEDSQEFCEGCHRELDCSYTNYAIESELDHFEEHGVSGPADEHSLYTILACGVKEQERERLLRVGFRWLWSTLHTKPGECWNDNPTLVRLAFDYPEATR